MVYFKDSQTYLQQSNLLISARPTTTRISTRYTLLPTSHPSLNRPPRTPQPPSSSTATSQPPPQHERSRAFVILKTYDPVSGTCLKYRTDKAAEVGRLVAGLGRCARAMAGLVVEEEKEGKEEERRMEGVETAPAGKEVGGKDGVREVGKEVGKDGKGKAGGGGGGKKKKGKR